LTVNYVACLWSMDEQLSLSAVAAITSCGKVRPIIRSLSTTAADTLDYAFVWSRLDYCNALLYEQYDNCR